MTYSRGSSQPRDWTCISCVSWIDRCILYHCTTWESPCPITSWQIEREKWKQWQILYSWAPKSLQMVTAAMKLKDSPWKKSYDQTRQCIKNQRQHFADKGLYSQSYGFSSNHVLIWELELKESSTLKNWCFWKVVLEDSWESHGLQGDQTSQS